MTESLFFDTDCLSAFLWVRAENILTELYRGKIKIPQQVYDELSSPVIAHLKMRIDALINNGDAIVQSIITDTPAHSFYVQLTSAPNERRIIIGKGEAAAIVLASLSSGILASNNIKDVAPYISDLNLKHITTGDILVKAFQQSLISEDDGNLIWSAMLAKRRKLGALSFTDYLNN